MKPFLPGLLAAAVALIPIAASADVWIDDKVRSLTLQAPGLQTTALTAKGRSASEAARLFKQVCLTGKFDRASVNAGLAASGWGFSFVDKMMPFKEPVNIGGFHAPDALLNASDGIFFNKVPQCNLLVRTAEPFQQNAAEAALIETLGAPPSNLSEATKKGKPNRSYQPKWIVSGDNGSAFVVTVRRSVIDPGVTHLAALQNVSKK